MINGSTVAFDPEAAAATTTNSTQVPGPLRPRSKSIPIRASKVTSAPPRFCVGLPQIVADQALGRKPDRV